MNTRIKKAFIKGSTRRAMEGRTHPLTAEIRKTLHAIKIRSPAYAPVMRHSIGMKNLSLDIAQAILKKEGEVDSRLLGWATLAHDSLRDLNETHSGAAQRYWSKIGENAIIGTIDPHTLRSGKALDQRIESAQKTAGKLGAILGSDMTWTLRNYKSWPLERKIVSYCDNVNRGVKLGHTFVIGFVLPETALRLAITQRKEHATQVDALVREHEAIKKFEAEMTKKGVNLRKLVQSRMKKNPKGYISAVNSAIDPHIEEIIAESKRRQGMRS